MNPQDALRILDTLTDPRNAAKITRGDYMNGQLALEALAKFVGEHLPKPAAPAAPPADAPKADG